MDASEHRITIDVLSGNKSESSSPCTSYTAQHEVIENIFHGKSDEEIMDDVIKTEKFDLIQRADEPSERINAEVKDLAISILELDGDTAAITKESEEKSNEIQSISYDLVDNIFHGQGKKTDTNEIMKQEDQNTHRNEIGKDDIRLNESDELIYEVPINSGTLISAAQDMTIQLSDALNTITSTPPTPPPRATPSVRTPLPPTPPPPISYQSISKDIGDERWLPSPPSNLGPEVMKISPSDDRKLDMEEFISFPPQSSDCIQNLEKIIETQYKKYPKVESTPPRAPITPERSSSQGKLKSVGSSPLNTPTQRRKITIRAIRTPSQSPIPFGNTALQVVPFH